MGHEVLKISVVEIDPQEYEKGTGLGSQLLLFSKQWIAHRLLFRDSKVE